MEQQQKILTFWDHLEELRHVLFRIAVAVVFLMLVALHSMSHCYIFQNLNFQFDQSFFVNLTFYFSS